MLRRLIGRLDDMALEVAWVAVAAVLGLVTLWVALNSSTAARASAVPVLGPAVGGARTLVNLVVHP